MSYSTLKAAREIAEIPGAIAVLRVLEAHGVNQVSIRDYQKGTLIECCSLDMMIQEIEKTRSRNG
jgi:hypothetical protein